MIKSLQRCQNCRFFKREWRKVQKGKPGRWGYYWWDEYKRQDNGVCRRYPPQLAGTELVYHGFPRVDENDYCGEWRPILESMNISAYTEE